MAPPPSSSFFLARGSTNPLPCYITHRIPTIIPPPLQTAHLPLPKSVLHEDAEPCSAQCAYTLVHSFACAIAPFSSSFQFWATSLASGSSGFGAPSRAWIERLRSDGVAVMWDRV
jgi:hypothetical protein